MSNSKNKFYKVTTTAKTFKVKAVEISKGLFSGRINYGIAIQILRNKILACLSILILMISCTSSTTESLPFVNSVEEISTDQGQNIPTQPETFIVNGVVVNTLFILGIGGVVELQDGRTESSVYVIVPKGVKYENGKAYTLKLTIKKVVEVNGESLKLYINS